MARTPPPANGFTRVVLAWVGFLLLILAHFGIRPLVQAPVTADFALMAVLFSSVRMRPGFATLTGFLVGLAFDAIVPQHFGAQMLVFAVVAFGASWLKAVFFTDNIGLTGLFIFVGKWLVDLLLALLVGTGTTPLWMALLVWAPLSALLTTLMALTLLTVFRPLYRPHGT